jgi:hypothetical protein
MLLFDALRSLMSAEMAAAESMVEELSEGSSPLSVGFGAEFERLAALEICVEESWW